MGSGHIQPVHRRQYWQARCFQRARLAADAVVALEACRVEWYDDFVADVEFLDRVSFLDDLTNEFMAADEIGGGI